MVESYTVHKLVSTFFLGPEKKKKDKKKKKKRTKKKKKELCDTSMWILDKPLMPSYLKFEIKKIMSYTK